MRKFIFEAAYAFALIMGFILVIPIIAMIAIKEELSTYIKERDYKWVRPLGNGKPIAELPENFPIERLRRNALIEIGGCMVYKSGYAIAVLHL